MSKIKEDCVGNKYGRLLVIDLNEEESTKHHDGVYYNCVCDCGNKCVANKYRLIHHQKRSCGCIHKEQIIQRNHDTAKLGGDSKNEYAQLHNSWTAMKNRCLSPLNMGYDLYGGRGITIYAEWLVWENFKQWALNNGWKPNLTIDRIDVNGNYEPDNCRWATFEVQANNTRNNKYLMYNGKTQTLSEWCKELHLPYDRTKARLNTCNMTVEQAFELPKQNLKRKIRKGD